MTSQIPLLDWSPGARASDPDTSHMAARLNPLRRDGDRWRVLLYHAAYPNGLTDFQGEDISGIKQSSFGKRRGELRDMGYIADSGRRLPTSITASGRRLPGSKESSAIVWKITADGLARARDAA